MAAKKLFSATYKCLVNFTLRKVLSFLTRKNYNLVCLRSFVGAINLRGHPGACVFGLPAAGLTIAANCRRPGLLDLTSISLVPFVTLL